jgi:hypothetical protein
MTEPDQVAQYPVYYGASGYRSRQVAGFMEGYRATEKVIEQICKDTATRIGLNNEGNLFPWVWGPTYDVAMTIDPHDAILESYEEQDPTTVINDVSISYGRSFAGLDYGRNVGSGQIANYSGTVKRNAESTDYLGTIAAKSAAVYGNRPLEEVETYYIGDEQSALTLAEYYLTVYQQPWKLLTINLPYDKYRTLRMFEVVRFGHPALPSYYGASSEAGGIYCEGDIVDLKNGRDWIAAKSFRYFIEGRAVSMELNGAPMLTLTLRILDHEDDPT